MRVLELRGELNLPPEAVEAHTLRHVAFEDLYNDQSLQGALFCHKDPAHPTPAELPVEGVGVPEISVQRAPQVRRGVEGLLCHCGKVPICAGWYNRAQSNRHT